MVDPALTPEPTVEELADEAWRVLRDLVLTGQARLRGGKVLAPEDERLISVMEHVAKFKAPRRRTLPQVEDFVAPETRRHAPTPAEA